MDGVAGFVEGPRFYPYLSGRRNLQLLADYDGGGARNRIDEVLDIVELRDRAKHKVGGYSHGMRQRLGIAASLLRSPRMLLLDEPTTGLDPAGMRDMRALVRRLAGEGITVLLSSHLLAEVEELCNRVAIIRKGRILYEGALAELLATASEQYRLRAVEPDRARLVCLAHAGLEDVQLDGDEIVFRANEDAVAALSIALGQARVGFTSLAPRSTSLEELFLGMTEGDPGDAQHRPGGGCLMHGVATVYRWELVKLATQKRTYLGLGAAVLVPIAFVVALAVQKGAGPTDVPLGRTLRDTGLATPFVVLFFLSIWGLPLITALVAGDIVASESHNGTLKTILTRSLDRGQIFAGKTLATLTYMAAAVLAMARRGTRGRLDRVGPASTDVALRHDRARRPQPRAARREPRHLRHRARRRRGVRADAVHRDPQQRRVRGRNADVRSADATARRAARHREHPAVPARYAVRRLARLPPHPGRLDARRASALGLRPVHRHPPGRRLHRLPPPRRRGRVATSVRLGNSTYGTVMANAASQRDSAAVSLPVVRSSLETGVSRRPSRVPCSRSPLIAPD